VGCGKRKKSAARRRGEQYLSTLMFMYNWGRNRYNGSEHGKENIR
jgi:hypothetical protein